MTIWQSVLLGIVQGLTEFLPISSSAHLVLVPFWLNWHIPADESFIFNVLVQMGTLAAVVVYFWKDLVEIVVAAFQGLIHRKPFASPASRLGWWVVVATIPAGVFGLLVKNQVEAAFNSPMLTAIFLLVTAVLLILGDWLGKRQKKLDEMTWLDALIIGFFQALSIFPGISRSGSTITGGMIRKFTRVDAARFSFLMSIPIMASAGAMALTDLIALPTFSQLLPTVLIGTLVAAIVGYLSIRWLLRFLVNHSFFGFAMYCIAIWLITFIVSIIRG